MYVCMYVCMHACMHACMCICVCACVSAIRMCVPHIYVCVCVCVCVCACMRVYVRVYVHMYIRTYVRTHTRTQARMHACTVRHKDVQPVPVSIVVSIPACHAGDRGSIPRRGDAFFPVRNELLFRKNYLLHCRYYFSLQNMCACVRASTLLSCNASCLFPESMARPTPFTPSIVQLLLYLLFPIVLRC